MTTPQQTLERAYAALNAAAFAHPSAADDIGTQCSEAAKELRALLAQPSAAPPAPGGDVQMALARMDALLDPERNLLSVSPDSATAQGCRNDMLTIRRALAALQSTATQGQDAAPAEQVQDDEPTWQELEDFRKRHWTHWNAADNLLIAHLAQKLKCAARAKE